MPQFKIDGSGQREPLHHVWERIVGSGHASLALGADWMRWVDGISRYGMSPIPTASGLGHKNFELYRYAVEAINRMDPYLRVGGHYLPIRRMQAATDCWRFHWASEHTSAAIFPAT